MTLQWTSVQPSEEGFYWASLEGRETFGMVYLRNGICCLGGPTGMGIPVNKFDLFSWPVEVPPSPIRETAKEVTDVPPTATA